VFGETGDDGKENKEPVVAEVEAKVVGEFVVEGDMRKRVEKE